jgi:hypothetical protein
VNSSAPRHWLLDKASYSDGLESPDEFAGGWVSAKETRSGGVTIVHADRHILVDSEHIYLIVEGKGPAWITLAQPACGDQKNLLDSDDIRQAGEGEFVGWSVHIHGSEETLVYEVGMYRGSRIAMGRGGCGLGSRHRDGQRLQFGVEFEGGLAKRLVGFDDHQ